MPMGALRIFFSGMGKLGVRGRKSPSLVPTTECEKYCINNSSTERFAVTTNAQKHYTTFPEGSKCPLLPIPAGAHAGSFNSPPKVAPHGPLLLSDVVYLSVDRDVDVIFIDQHVGLCDRGAVPTLSATVVQQLSHAILLADVGWRSFSPTLSVAKMTIDIQFVGRHWPTMSVCGAALKRTELCARYSLFHFQLLSHMGVHHFYHLQYHHLHILSLVHAVFHSELKT